VCWRNIREGKRKERERVRRERRGGRKGEGVKTGKGGTRERASEGKEKVLKKRGVGGGRR